MSMLFSKLLFYIYILLMLFTKLLLYNIYNSNLVNIINSRQFLKTRKQNGTSNGKTESHKGEIAED